MLVSWDWLKEYVELDMSHDELADKLTMSGLNHEGTETVGGDQSIDLEVTSNRPDCLGHIGVAREVAVLYDKALKIPATDIPANRPAYFGFGQCGSSVRRPLPPVYGSVDSRCQDRRQSRLDGQAAASRVSGLQID